ncbi:Unknown protein [Striga hermonthica]|uniref:HAT C-terminal dimerisation domain-containing protein n=1 Tax=Striga hermonthica TaxID=68872 RepID=A0A9N7RP39_STRHE|nr:Unknown protein [Striga hermonthica]
MPADSKRNGTRGLLNHLYHRCESSSLRVVMDKSQPTLTQSMMEGEVKISDFNQKRLDKMCVKWIIKAEMPFRTVEQPDFKEFILDLQPRYKIPNRRKIAKDVWSLFCEEKAKIKSIIGDLRGEDIGRCLEEKLVEWGISKVFAITVDNASSNDVAVEYLKKQLRKHDGLMLDENLHMRCACHIINLIVKDGMKELVDSIEAIRNCVMYIHSSSARLDKFWEYAVLEKKDKMSTIPMDVVTRWNATYIMLHSANKFKGVFARVVKAHLYLMYETCKGTEKSHVDVHEDGDDGVDLGGGGGDDDDDEDDDDDDVELRIERRLNRQRKEAKLKEIANEVDKYFNDAYESTRNDDFDLLAWCKSKISSYSILSKVAKDVLAFPSSTVASENAFSLGGRIVDPFRASLTSKMVEALVCTNDWLRGEEFQFHKEPTEEELEFYMELEQLEQSIPNTNEMPPPPSKSSNPPESGINKLQSHPSRGGRGGRGRSNRGGRGGGATSSSKLRDEVLVV